MTNVDKTPLQVKAAEALKYFHKGKRSNGEEYWYAGGLEKIPGTDSYTASDVPEWIREMCRDAHGDMMPNDWKYEFIVEALNKLADENRDDVYMEADIYTSELTAWLASHLDRVALCDEAAEMGDASGLEEVLRNGQQYEKQQVLESIIVSLEKLISE